MNTNLLKGILLSFLVFSSSYAAPKTDLSIQLIPDSLSKNAYSVVRFSTCEYTYVSTVSASARFSYAVSVLTKDGISESYFIENGDKSTKLSKFRATLVDGTGKTIKTFGKSDIGTSAVSSHLATDNFRYYLDFTEPVLPFTMLYEYEMEYTGGIFQFPAFLPVSSFNQSVQQAVYTLNTPSGTQIQLKTRNFNGSFSENEVKGTTTRTWTLKNFKPVEYERFAPGFWDYMPGVLSSPVEFEFDKTKGVLSNTQTIIHWLQELCLNRSELTEATKESIVALTSGLKTDREKVEALYKHLGATTRYESIQLGVGGYQPIAASEVCRTGFGDCKGLSNYLKAMINHLGIEANLCVIRLDSKEKDLNDDFSALLRSNHMIVQVPLADDTLWLESTQTKIPFGYVHSEIAGHNALVSYNSGGKMERLPDYPDSLNREHYTLNILLDQEGNATGKVMVNWEVKEYDRMMGILTDNKQDQTDRLRKVINLPGVAIQSIQLTDKPSNFPSIDCSYELSSRQYAARTGNRLFIPVNIVRNTSAFFKKGERKQDIIIYQGWTDADEINLTIPEGYTIENIPPNQQVSNEFGSFRSILHVEGNRISIQQQFYIKSGRWDKKAYPSLRELYEKAVAGYSGKIILRKI